MQVRRKLLAYMSRFFQKSNKKDSLPNLTVIKVAITVYRFSPTSPKIYSWRGPALSIKSGATPRDQSVNAYGDQPIVV